MKNDLKMMDFEKMGLYYKIMVIGGKNVGKTQILKRFCKEKFDENYSPTFGMDFRIQKVYDERSKLTVKVQLVEVSGKYVPPQELLREYIIDADCFIGVYDISSENTVKELNNLVSYYEKIIPRDNKKQNWYFVGNKCDLRNREIPDKPSDIFGYTPLGCIGFIEVSAKDNRYINTMFNNVIFHEKNIKAWKMKDDNKFKPQVSKIKKEIKKPDIKIETKSKCLIY